MAHNVADLVVILESFRQFLIILSIVDYEVSNPFIEISKCQVFVLEVIQDDLQIGRKKIYHL